MTVHCYGVFLRFLTLLTADLTFDSIASAQGIGSPIKQDSKLP